MPFARAGCQGFATGTSAMLRLATLLGTVLVSAHAQSVFFQPFPLVANLTTGAATSAVFASSVTITVAGPSAPDEAAGCGDGTVCAAVTRRYQQLFAIKASANGPRPGCPSNVTISEIAVRLDSSSEELGPDTDESYEISVTPFTAPAAGVVASVTARTIFGAKHALEVLAQMVSDDPASTALTDACGNAGWLAATPLSVRDRPVNSYRGFMIDSGRHFLSIPRIKKTIDGLSMLRLNVLHWCAGHAHTRARAAVDAALPQLLVRIHTAHATGTSPTAALSQSKPTATLSWLPTGVPTPMGPPTIPPS